MLPKFFPKTLFSAVALGLLFASSARAADGTPVWTNIFNGAANNTDQATAVAVDGGGNVYVTGYSYGATNGYDYATIKYSSAGGPLWTNLFNGAANGNDVATSLAVDTNGNVIVTGYSYGGATRNDFTTIKYSSAGVRLWTNLFNGAGNSDDEARSVAVDGSGNVIVTGYSVGSGSGYDYATIKYSSAGVPLWTNLFNGAANGNDVATSLAVDTNGNVIVTGYSTAANGNPDYATIKYSSAGAPLWTNLFNGAGNGTDQAQAVAVDGSGNVIVTGYSYDSGSGFDYATIKYSSAGAPLWTNLFNGAGNGDDVATSLAVDISGNVIVTGYSHGSTSGADYATIKYSSAGVPLWTNRFNGAGNGYDQAQAVAVDAGGNVIVTGFSFGSTSSYDYATIKYSSAGVPLWTNLLNGAGNSTDEAASLAVDTNDNVIVTGYSSGSGGNYDYATIKYSGPASPVIYLQPTNQTVALTSNATFSVAAYGAAPLTYQWYLKGAGVARATNSILTVSNAGFVNVGNYQVIITNLFGSATSSVATLTVSNLPFALPVGVGSLGFANQRFYLTVTGPVGSNAVISASTNLQTWVPLATNPLSLGSLMFTDVLSTNFAKRFYRANLQ